MDCTARGLSSFTVQGKRRSLLKGEHPSFPKHLPRLHRVTEEGLSLSRCGQSFRQVLCIIDSHLGTYNLMRWMDTTEDRGSGDTDRIISSALDLL